LSGGEKRGCAPEVLRVLVFLFPLILFLLGADWVWAYSTLYRGSVIFHCAHGDMNPSASGDTSNTCLSVFLGHSNPYGVPGLSFNGISVGYNKRGCVKVEAGFSSLRYSTIYRENELKLYSAFPFMNRFLYISADFRLLFLGFSEDVREFKDILYTGISFLPARYICLSFERRFLDVNSSSYDRSFSLAVRFGLSTVEYRRVRFFSAADDLFSLCTVLNRNLSVTFGYRLRSDEILAGVEAHMSGVLIRVVSVSHPVLGTSFFMGVGWMWFLGE